jgi:hypothetical protein
MDLDSEQFAVRYADCDGEYLTDAYRFADAFERVEIDRTLDAPKGERFEAFVLRSIEDEVRATGARVVVIDAIDGFTRSVMRNANFGFVMKRLRRLKQELRLSILVLAHLSQRSPAKPLEADRLLASRTVASDADSVFAIGECRWDDRRRYIKHLRSKRFVIVHDASYVPTFRLTKPANNFLSFEFEGFRPEAFNLDTQMTDLRLQRSDLAKHLRDQGRTQREIAAELEIPLTTVNRSLHIWSPYDEELLLEQEEAEREARAKAEREALEIAKTAEQARKDRPLTEEEIAERKAFDISSNFYTRQYMLSVGLPPPPSLYQPHEEAIRLADLARIQHQNSDSKYGQYQVPEDIGHLNEMIGSLDSRDHSSSTTLSPADTDALADEMIRELESRSPSSSSSPSRHLSLVTSHVDEVVTDPLDPMHGLIRTYTREGREIFVARKCPDTGRPTIWFTRATRPGRFHRHEFRNNATGTTFVTQINERFVEEETYANTT